VIWYAECKKSVQRRFAHDSLYLWGHITETSNMTTEDVSLDSNLPAFKPPMADAPVLHSRCAVHVSGRGYSVFLSRYDRTNHTEALSKFRYHDRIHFASFLGYLLSLFQLHAYVRGRDSK
jgi:hypothetical protein